MPEAALYLATPAACCVQSSARSKCCLWCVEQQATTLLNGCVALIHIISCITGSTCSDGAGGVLSLALLSVITAVAQGNEAAAPDADTLQRLRDLDLGHGAAVPACNDHDSTPSPTAGHHAAQSSAQPASDQTDAGDHTDPPQPPTHEGTVQGWGLPAADVINRARGGVQGFRSWSSKRLGQLGNSLAETVETVKVKGACMVLRVYMVVLGHLACIHCTDIEQHGMSGADVARGALTRYPSGGGGGPRGPLTSLRGVPREAGLSADDVQDAPEELPPTARRA